MSKIKKILVALIASALLMAVVPAAHADFSSDIGQWFGEAFSTGGEEGLSFTQFEGGVTQLNADGYDSSLTQSSDAREFILTIVNFALSFLGLLAVIIIIYGGVLYVTSGGEEEQTGKGKKAIQYAVIGLLIVLGSFAFVNTVIQSAGDGQDGGGGSIFGQDGILITTGATGGGFNASAEQVRSVAMSMFANYKFVDQTIEDLRNIVNDVEKSSLDPNQLPRKPAINSFLISVRGKLSNIRSRTGQLSEARTTINELIREVEDEMDLIDNLNGSYYYKKGNWRDSCNPTDSGFLEGFSTGASSSKNHCDAAGYVESIAFLPDRWEEIQKEYNHLGADKRLDKIASAVIEDFVIEFENGMQKLNLVHNSVKNFEAVSGAGTTAGQTFATMQNSYGFESIVAAPDNITMKQNGAWAQLVASRSPLEINSVKQIVGEYSSSVKENNFELVTANFVRGLEAHSKFYDAIKNIEFVKARLTADVVDGNAPLTVIFTVLGTQDPAGGSLSKDNILWDLAGTKTIDGLLAEKSYGKILLPEDIDAFNCSFYQGDLENTDEKVQQIGVTAQRCTFEHPGTYTAAVKIRSNDSTKFAPGISVLTIKAQPPTTKIDLKIKDNSGEIIVNQYQKNSDAVLISRKRVTVSKKAAEAGIEFDASDTKAEKYRWTFNNGEEPIGFGTQDKVKPTFSEPGEYEIILEVLNKLQVLDRKIFILEVSEVTARVDSTPEDHSFIDQTVTFDGGRSAADVGSIKQYSWSISPTSYPVAIKDELEKIYPFEKSGSSKNITHKFKYPLSYNISLTVTDNNNNNDTFTIEKYTVSSQPPVALFSYDIPSESQPAKVHFNSSRSYDADGNNEFLEYEWLISPTENWNFVQDSDANSKNPIIKFAEAGDYEIKLKVSDSLTEGSSEESDTFKDTVRIENVLDIGWGPNQEATSVIDESGKANVSFYIESDKGIAYEIDFGDGENSTGSIEQTATISHSYQSADKYTVIVTVFDEEDNDNSIQRRFFVGDSNNPVAKATIFVDGTEIQNTSEPIDVNKKSIITFDASDSKNIDGTARKLKYSWDFGDRDKSSNKTTKHSYSELSPKEIGFYDVKLLVSDKDDPTLQAEDSVQINVINQAPTFSSIQAVPETKDGDLITPVRVEVKAHGAEDEDGEITQYRWWYFDLDDPDEALGIQITKIPSARLNIGTHGKEGQKITYGIGLQVTDSDNIKVSSSDFLQEAQIPTVEVTNGKNDLPEAKFKVNVTKTFTGEKVTFTSASKDSDGEIEEYIWDFEGDGFFNNDPTSEASVEHIYEGKNLEGYEVRLKVIDDKGGESISDPIKIYIDSLANPPKAAFKFELVTGSAGKKVKFINNSTADQISGATIISYKWDFDTASILESADSDGDGAKDNDIDSQLKDPSRLYTEFGKYFVKLTIVDDQGNIDTITRELSVPLASPPTAAFTYSASGSQIIFQNNSTADEEGGAKLSKFTWDFDTDSDLITADSNGDGQKDNDDDSNEKNPVYTYPQAGTYNVKLSVIDDFGSSSEVTRPVVFGPQKDIRFGQDVGKTLSGLGAETSAGNPLASSGLSSLLETVPAPSEDGIIYIEGDAGQVTFDFSKSKGQISYYVIDKNIYFDTNGNGIKNDDSDFKTILPGTWKTNFEKIWGKTVVKLTIIDIYGNEHSSIREIKFK
ncbi:PKD domain-containing protein [Candidatus Gracilibacteria bacterium]|nr:PKD domain-containing protein [Candidatus Gracilibacteria bacterium]